MTLPKTCSLYESCDFWEGPGLVLTFPHASDPSPQCRVQLLAPLGHHVLALHEEGGLVGFPPARSWGSGDGFGTLRALPARSHVPTQDADAEPRRFSSRLRAGRASRLGFWGCWGLAGLEGEVVGVPATLKGALLWVLMSDLSWAAPPWPLQAVLVARGITESQNGWGWKGHLGSFWCHPELVPSPTSPLGDFPRSSSPGSLSLFSPQRGSRP